MEQERGDDDVPSRCRETKEYFEEATRSIS